MKLFKKIIVLFFIGTMLLSSYVYADDYKLHTVNFNIEGGEYLTEDIELILYYDDDTCTSILLENKNNYSASTVLREGEVKVEILNLIENENVNVEYDKEININKDMDYIVTISEIKAEETEVKESNVIKRESEEIEESNNSKKEVKENKNYQSTLTNILNTITVTCAALGIVGIIFIIIYIRRLLK